MPEEKNDFLVVDHDRVNKIKESLVPENLIVAMSENFRVLSDPTRIRILLALENGELCVCDIAALINLPQPSVSHHLKALRQLGIIKFKKSGKMTLYSLKDIRISGLLAVARDFSRNHV
ncbi:MAG: winged helix-turn-helix transcriptional regulator [Candidatus Zixiibacteriota bacterium]|nr:MAG: winged helix-turn-helix transcriptional regulator [candidate division Zixibacteria bacterium]